MTSRTLKTGRIDVLSSVKRDSSVSFEKVLNNSNHPKAFAFKINFTLTVIKLGWNDKLSYNLVLGAIILCRFKLSSVIQMMKELSLSLVAVNVNFKVEQET